MEWTEYTFMHKKLATYDAKYVRLLKRASEANQRIRAKDKKHEAVRRTQLISTYNAFIRLTNHIHAYIDHAKKHRHRAEIILSPKHVKRYFKNGFTTRRITLRIDRLKIENDWALDCQKKLKARISKKIYKL